MFLSSLVFLAKEKHLKKMQSAYNNFCFIFKVPFLQP